jgi:hypothetical protein
MFMFRLALALGMTVEELGERMSSKELSEWIAFNAISPIGDERGDLQAGIVASVMANCHRTKGQPFKPVDFMPFVKNDSTPEAALAQLRKTMKKEPR